MLNPHLFEHLQREFPRVSITNPDQPVRLTYAPDSRNPGRLRSTRLGPAEHYCVACPACGDRASTCTCDTTMDKQM